jgi:glycosyltransferase involved in cell wall biosynthesis
MKRIAIIGTNGLPGRYGGWDQLMEHLTKILVNKYDFIVYCSTYNAEKKNRTHNGAQLVFLPLKANGWQSVLYDILSSIHAIFYADTMLLLGGAGTVMFPLFKLFGKEVIYHPDGIEWKRQKWSRQIQLYLKWLEKVGIRWANKIVSDNVEISDYIEKEYGKPSFLIEYGGDHVSSVSLSTNVQKLYNIEKGTYAFKVCRIEPENNLDLILDAFSNTEVRLIIVGNWTNSTYGLNLRKKHQTFKNIIMLDPIYDQLKLDELRSNCGIYIHGHSVGGTNPSLVEAMCLGLNVLSFNVSYNKATTDHSALYFKDVVELRKLLINFSENNLIFDGIGSTLKKIAEERYLWANIVSKYDWIFQDKSKLTR